MPTTPSQAAAVLVGEGRCFERPARPVEILAAAWGRPARFQVDFLGREQPRLKRVAELGTSL